MNNVKVNNEHVYDPTRFIDCIHQIRIPIISDVDNENTMNGNNMVNTSSDSSNGMDETSINTDISIGDTKTTQTVQSEFRNLLRVNIPVAQVCKFTYIYIY
jgi:hypothetical protein